jgi:precorrin-6B methylase 2
MRDFWISWASTKGEGPGTGYGRRRVLSVILTLCLVSVAVGAAAQKPQKPYEPVPGQSGKDAVWVPTPPELIEKMLDLAKVTPEDFVMDLGSGDGRNVIAAAKRGARALGVEYEQKLVVLSRQLAEKEGVADKATFVRGDMFKADVSKATVLALFLLPEHFTKLTPKFLAMRPGSRIVINTFQIPKWEVDETERINSKCSQWCTALLYIVPARVAGTWRLADGGSLVLRQEFQMLTGTLTNGKVKVPIANGRLRGNDISFSAGGAQYTGRVNGNAMSGEFKGEVAGTWAAKRR